MCLVADGTTEADDRITKVLTTDPGTAIVRHVDAGYAKAKEVALEKRLKIPFLDRKKSA